MSKLRVGDIVVDGRNVSIDGQNLASARPPQPPTNPPRTASSASPLTRPVVIGALGVGGVVVSVLGGISFLASANPWSIGAYIFSGGLVGSAGCGLMALAGVGVVLRRREDRLARDREEHLLKGAVERVAMTIRALGGMPTLAKVVSSSALPTATVVRALAALRDRGEIREDLNVDTGEWQYALIRTLAPDTQPKNLDEWISDLERTKQR